MRYQKDGAHKMISIRSYTPKHVIKKTKQNKTKPQTQTQTLTQTKNKKQNKTKLNKTLKNRQFEKGK